MTNKIVLLLVVAAVAIIIGGTIVALPSFTQQTPPSQQPEPEVIASSADPGSVLKLSSASILVDIPLIKGYENGNEIFFTGTDVSDPGVATMLTDVTGFKVNHAPLLAQTPEDARGQVYVFENGVEGDGPLGFQVPVTNAKPGDEGYSPLQQVNLVNWTDESAAIELKSVDAIMEHEGMGHLAINQTDVVANHPAVKWDGGSIQIREDRDNINADSPYVGGQVTEINTDDMTVTFVAHRGWGPDGKTIYYIVTDAVPDMPAAMMGVSFAPADEKLVGTPVAVDLFQFTNGINGTGPMGFQAGIGGANPEDENYSPMWKISFISWKDPSQARVLETQADIIKAVTDGLADLAPAMEGKHIVNCPFFSQQTVFAHMSK
ncbi:MAG TPA: hypothetical protein VGQ03_03855 [Nitrososphaera sp.]|jgi:hypothetical protein|nr:hypothetical protein [Nitrososphaera sp.]